MKTPRTLLFDIETMANLGYIWGKYEQNVISFKRHWYIITFAYKWLGEKTVHCVSLPDFPLYKKDPYNDRDITKTGWKLFNEADIIIAHNGNAFDVKKMQAKFIQHKLRPPSPFQTVDTKLVAKRHFKFDSNKLDDLGEYLGVGRKLVTEGWPLWEGCLNNDPEAWKKMVRYNKQDVALLERVYLEMRPWMTNHPNLNLILDTHLRCRNCGSKNLARDGVRRRLSGYSQEFRCRECGKYLTAPISKKEELGIVR